MIKLELIFVSKEYLERIDIKEIREAVVHYTNRKEYVRRVADFKSFR